MGKLKQGLDYFPMTTDFIQNRIVRRVLKHEGDAALGVILQTLCYIYSDHGYYVQVDAEYFDELADHLFSTDNSAVERIIRRCVDYGLFDARLYDERRVLSSPEIQRRYLFVARRRRHRNCIDPQLLLLSAEEVEEFPSQTSASPVCRSAAREEGSAVPEARREKTAVPEANLAVRQVAAEESVAAQWSSNAPSRGVNAALGTPYKRKEKERKEEESIADILPNPPCREGGGSCGEAEGGELSSATPAGSIRRPVRTLTEADIDRLQPPADGRPRNLSGLIESLRLYRISPAEQYAIVLKSNYGEIGGIVWRGLSELRSAGSKIKLPGHYLLSLLRR